MRGWLAIGLCVLGIAPAVAAETAVLARAAALQPPVWLERDGARRALNVGETLRAGDRYQTGAGGRLQIRLEEDSTIKIGADARFALPAMRKLDDGSRGGLFKGALEVLKGAFRFTTSAVGKLRHRELDVSIGPTVTIGIRGTDIWGKSDAQRDLVCLIEGKIEVSSPGQAPQRMEQPLSYYYVPRGAAAPPVAPAPREDLDQWVPQTELHEDQPALYDDGRYAVSLVSYAERRRAERKARELSEQGYATAIEAYRHEGQQRHRLVTTGFRSAVDAQRFADAMKTRLGLPFPWVLSPR